MLSVTYAVLTILGFQGPIRGQNFAKIYPTLLDLAGDGQGMRGVSGLVSPSVAFRSHMTVDFLTARWAVTTSGLRRMYFSNDLGTVES